MLKNKSKSAPSLTSMRYELAFRPWPNPRPLFSLADALALLPQGSRMAFVGDSTGAQIFFGALCDLARSGQVASMSMLQNLVIDRRRRDEVNVTLSGDLGMRRLLHLREPTFGAEAASGTIDRLLRQLCADVDVLVFNTGLWYSWGYSERHSSGRMRRNHTELSRIIGELAVSMDLHCAGTVKIFRGSLTQHFSSVTGEWTPRHTEREDLEAYRGALAQMHDKDEYGGSCRPHLWDSDHYSQITVAANESAEQRYDWRNYFVVDAFARAGYDVALTPWGREQMAGCINNSRRTLHYVPMGEVTADRFDLHPGLPGPDCSHMCSAASITHVVTDAIFLAVRQVRDWLSPLLATRACM
jgi:hypothetical protein